MSTVRVETGILNDMEVLDELVWNMLSLEIKRKLEEERRGVCE